LTSITTDGLLFIYDVKNTFQPIGYINMIGIPQAIFWSVNEEEKGVYYYKL
jgi:hypothetical protein